MKSFSCGDVVPGCTARFTGRTTDEIMSQVAEHAAVDHGLSPVPAQVDGAVRARISETS